MFFHRYIIQLDVLWWSQDRQSKFLWNNWLFRIHWLWCWICIQITIPKLKQPKLLYNNFFSIRTIHWPKWLWSIIFFFWPAYSTIRSSNWVLSYLYLYGCLLSSNFSLLIDSAMSVDDEKRQIAELAINLIDRVDFDRDFQQMLSFYGDARAAFTNLDPVLAHLVHVSLLLFLEIDH